MQLGEHKRLFSKTWNPKLLKGSVYFLQFEVCFLDWLLQQQVLNEPKTEINFKVIFAHVQYPTKSMHVVSKIIEFEIKPHSFTALLPLVWSCCVD